VTDEPADTPEQNLLIDNNHWLDREEAAKLLRRTPRQVERRAKQGFIQTTREEQPWQRKAKRYFSRADILAILEDKPNRYPVQASQRSTSGNGGNDGQEGGRGTRGGGADGHPEATGVLIAAPKRPWLTLTEASTFSGLPEEWLRGQAQHGTIHCLNVGKEDAPVWMFSRKGLKKVGKA